MVAYQSPNLRAGRSRSEESAEDLRRMKSLFLWFVAITLSIFLNYTNLRRKRNRGGINFPAFLAVIVDLAILLTLPVHALYPLLVVVSTVVTNVLTSNPSSEPRPAVLVASLLTSATNLFVFPLPQNLDISGSRYLVYLNFAAAFCCMIHFLIHRVSFLRNFFCGLLSASSALAVNITSSNVYPHSLILTTIIVLLSRRTVAMNLRQINAEYASWSILSVTVIGNMLLQSSTMSLILSVTCGVAIRFLFQPCARNLKQDQPAPITTVVTASSMRRKNISGNFSAVELKQVVTLTDENIEWDANVPSEQDSTIPPNDSGAVNTRSSSGVIVVRSSDHLTVDSVELDEDEDEIFRRITTL